MRSQYGRRRAGAGQASNTANMEMLDEDATLIGLFGDYVHLPRSRCRWWRDGDPEPAEGSSLTQAASR